MVPDLSVLLDHLASGLVEVRRQLCMPGALLIGERADAVEHLKVAYAAVVNLRRILRRAERRVCDGDAETVARLLPTHDAVPGLTRDLTSADWSAVHEEIKSTDILWRSLAFDGLQSDGRGGLIEYRRCPHCSSTLGRQISRQEAIQICQVSAEVHARSLEALANAPCAPRRRAARK